MRKIRYLLVLLIVFFAISGCSKNSEKDEKETETELQTVDPSSAEDLNLPSKGIDTSTQRVDNVDDELTDVEKLFCIDQDQRKDMIEKFGEDTYWTGVNTASQIWQTQFNSTSPVSEDNLELYDEKYKVNIISLTSTLDGHTIPADYITQGEDKNKDTVIFIHGSGENRRNFPSTVNEFLDRGYNVLSYDQRSAGDNTARLCTFGLYEQYDLQQCIDYVDDIIDSNKKIYIYARSQGGCTACRVLGSENGNEKLDGAMLDCPLSSMRTIMKKMMAQHGVEDIDKALEASDKITDYLFGFTVDDCEMTDYIQNTTVPTLVMTSDCDAMVDKSMPISLYDAIKNDKKYLLVSEVATHCSLQSMEEKYDETIDKFLSGELFN